FITSKYKADVAQEIVSGTPGVQVRLMIDGTAPGYESYEDAVATRPTTPIDDESEGTDMLYSSGTTGRPKGVRLPLPEGPMGQPSGVTVLGQMLYGFN